MNIFYLDRSNKRCARYLCDQHIRKMGIEHCQLLGNCYSDNILLNAPHTQKDLPRIHTHINHPCSKWVKSNIRHFLWLQNYTTEIFLEYKRRFDKNHYTKCFLDWTYTVRPYCITNDFQIPPQCMPDCFKNRDTIIAYRNYYKYKSTQFKMTWTNSNKPEWMNEKY